MSVDRGQSPFCPGQPVPVDLFVGRAAQIDRIVVRGVRQVSAGKSYCVYVQGEYGIGKSSIARFVQIGAEHRFGLLGIYAMLSGATTLDDVGAAILDATVRAGAYNPRASEKIQDWLAKWVGEQSLFGLTIHADALRKEGPKVAGGILPFLREALGRVRDAGIRGIFLILDEINGISSKPEFAHFIKGLVDGNALDREPIPLLLMLCGVEERRREMIRNHQPIDRVFDVVDIGKMTKAEMEEFFQKAFSSVRMEVEPRAMDLLTRYSAGFPKIMHLVGDAAFWLDTDGVVDLRDAVKAVTEAADEFGRRYVDQQVYAALKSEAYRSILGKIGSAALEGDATIRRADISAELAPAERGKLDNFLRKMRQLKVLRPGSVQGEYVFAVRMVALYIWLRSQEPETRT